MRHLEKMSVLYREATLFCGQDKIGINGKCVNKSTTLCVEKRFAQERIRNARSMLAYLLVAAVL